MFRFERLDGVCIPVYYQQLLDTIKSSCVALAVFTGSGDDRSVGEPGLYHWFEHVPFRGTKKFPRGYEETQALVARVGGHVNAFTNFSCTCYHATLPTRCLRLGAEVVVDLVATPLISDEGVDAERTIIKEEIRIVKGGAAGYLSYILSGILWEGHPFGCPTLGDEESLDNMNAKTLFSARAAGYSRSRMALFVSTSLSSGAVLNMVSDLLETLPAGDIEGRQRGASFGSLPSVQAGRTVEISSDFAPTIVKMIFDLPPIRSKRDTAKRAVLSQLFTQGGLGSPLYRAVRGAAQLAYNANISLVACPDGGFWGFHVTTSKKNVEQVERALRGLFSDPELRSRGLFENVREGILGELEMELPDPHNFVRICLSTMVAIGELPDDEEMCRIAREFSHEEVLSWLDEIRPEDSRMVFMYGKE